MKVTRETVEATASNMETRKKVTESIHSTGLIIPPRPTNSEDLFKEWESFKNKYKGLGDMPYSALGDFLDRWASLIAYALWVEAAADTEYRTAREIRDTVKNQLYTLQEGGREIRAATVSTEELYIKWQTKCIEKEAIYIAIRSLREGYEHRASSISREITRRNSEAEKVGSVRL